MSEDTSFEVHRLLFEDKFERLEAAVARIESVQAQLDKDVAVLKAKAAMFGGLAALVIEVGFKFFGK
jgi:hypothetical protein